MPVKTLRALRSAAPGLSGRTAELLQRADAELVAAQFSSEPWEQFTHAHLAAEQVLCHAEDFLDLVRAELESAAAEVEAARAG
jgi:hypothetical protein